MTNDERPRILVAGIGNPDRGDDGVGPAAAARLCGRVSSDVRLLKCGGDILSLIEKWDDASDVFVIDAASPKEQPGRIHWLDLTNRPMPVDLARASTHSFGVVEAVELARSLGRLPRHLVLYLIEGERFDLGAPLSPAVIDAIDVVADSIFAEIARILSLHSNRDDDDA